ncbi:MAG: AbrB/MazE/SpoVT family DNA-binding domain-containing protein [Chloroflexi bacterium]|nr:AbrB/MazE/SpoVT family DNA-binding domain-containing protein [Chloroflexota bacterium]
MVCKKASAAILRPKRQVTLPRDEICGQLGIGPGQVLEMTVKDSAILARPRKIVVLESLREIQQTFQRSGLAEEQDQKAGHRVGQEVARERYCVRS